MPLDFAVSPRCREPPPRLHLARSCTTRTNDVLKVIQVATQASIASFVSVSAMIYTTIPLLSSPTPSPGNFSIILQSKVYSVCV